MSTLILPSVPTPDATSLILEPGYKAEVFASGLTYPTSIAFDAKGTVYTCESGSAPGDPIARCRVLKLSPDGSVVVVADQLPAPINDLLWNVGLLYISCRGKIVVIPDGGVAYDLITDLPSNGDYSNNQMSAGPDGKLYFGQGTATNSGVVGLDTFRTLDPTVHDVPARDTKLHCTSYRTVESQNLTSFGGVLGSLFTATKTGAFQAFGSHSLKEVTGVVKANGTILRCNLDGTELEVYADGFRNPYSVRWYRGELYVSDSGMENRGSRPVQNGSDSIWKVEKGAWHGFPDYVSGESVLEKKYRPKGSPKLSALVRNPPTVAVPWVVTPVIQSPSSKFDISIVEEFGFKGQLFTGVSMPVAGVVRYDEGGVPVTFVKNKKMVGVVKGFENYTTSGMRTPVECHFAPDGRELYVVDLGAIYRGDGGVVSAPGTGVIWKITRG